MKWFLLMMMLMPSAWSQDMDLVQEGLENANPNQALNCPKPQHPGKKYTKILFVDHEALRFFFQNSAQKKDLYDRVLELRKRGGRSEFKKWNPNTGSYFCFGMKLKSDGQAYFDYKTLSCPE